MHQSGILRNAGGSSLRSSPMSKREKKKKTLSVPPDLPVEGHFYFQVDDWSEQMLSQWPRNPVFRSKDEVLYGNSWQLVIYPRGSLTENSPFVEAHLINKTNRDIRARYTISLLNQSTCEYDFSWSDPDGMVLFRRHGDDDDYWGNCEYIELEKLEAPPYRLNNSVKFRVNIVANIADELGALTPTTNPMGDVKPGTSLEKATSDLQQLSTHMSEQKVRMLKEEEMLQDSLVQQRAWSMKRSTSQISAYTS